MWYVMQVRSGKEEEIRRQCQNTISSAVLQKSFLPYYEELRRYEGAWHKQLRLLFPGYVFLVTEKPEELYQELKHIIGLTRLLGTGREILPLRQEEIDFLLQFGRAEQIVELSTGIIKGDRVIVLQGPLKGREAYIRRVDRHKRAAWLDLELFGRRVEARVGLEIVRRE